MSNQTKSRGIIFNSEIVNAILENRKSMTRRIVKIQPNHIDSIISQCISSTHTKDVGRVRWVVKDGEYSIHSVFSSKYFNIPYEVGEKVWVKEDFNFISDSQDGMSDQCYYKAEHLKMPSEVMKREEEFMKKWGHSWKSGYFMKREQSRITLKITNIRVERLQDISDDDCLAEGIFFTIPNL